MIYSYTQNRIVHKDDDDSKYKRERGWGGGVRLKIKFERQKGFSSLTHSLSHTHWSPPQPLFSDSNSITTTESCDNLHGSLFFIMME